MNDIFDSNFITNSNCTVTNKSNNYKINILFNSGKDIDILTDSVQNVQDICEFEYGYITLKVNKKSFIIKSDSIAMVTVEELF